MFPPLIRMMLIGLSIVAAIVALNQGRETWILYFGAAIFLVFEHFKGGSIWLAFQAYRKQNFDKVRKYLSATKKPEWLRPSSRAYYHFLSGVISTIDKDYKKAKDLFLLAVNVGLRTDHMQSVTYCILADTSLHLNELDEAKAFFEKAKKIPHRDEIQPMFEDLSNRINEKA
jgi:tetratricopeptide (TPR) repeat protein